MMDDYDKYRNKVHFIIDDPHLENESFFLIEDHKYKSPMRKRMTSAPGKGKDRSKVKAARKQRRKQKK